VYVAAAARGGKGRVSRTNGDGQVAHIVTRNARRNLATALEEVAANTRIAEKTRQKQTLLETLEVLLKLQAVANMECRHRCGVCLWILGFTV
jgi:hypothetical protein